jgi:hypothetical protein
VPQRPGMRDTAVKRDRDGVVADCDAVLEGKLLLARCRRLRVRRNHQCVTDISGTGYALDPPRKRKT